MTNLNSCTNLSSAGFSFHIIEDFPFITYLSDFFLLGYTVIDNDVVIVQS